MSGRRAKAQRRAKRQARKPHATRNRVIGAAAAAALAPAGLLGSQPVHATTSQFYSFAIGQVTPEKSTTSTPFSTFELQQITRAEPLLSGLTPVYEGKMFTQDPPPSNPGASVPFFTGKFFEQSPGSATWMFEGHWNSAEPVGTGIGLIPWSFQGQPEGGTGG